MVYGRYGVHLFYGIYIFVHSHDTYRTQRKRKTKSVVKIGHGARARPLMAYRTAALTHNGARRSPSYISRISFGVGSFSCRDFSVYLDG